MATYELKYMAVNIAKNGKFFTEKEAGKFKVGDVLIYDDVQKPRRGRKAKTTRLTLKITGVGAEYTGKHPTTGDFKAQRYYGEFTEEEIK